MSLATPSLAPSRGPAEHVGIRRFDRNFIAALVVVSGLWIFGRAAPKVVNPVLVGDLLQLSLWVTAFLTLRTAQREGRLRLGKGGSAAVAAAGVWAASDLTWIIASMIRPGVAGWTNLGYIAATIGFAVAAYRCAAIDHRVDGRLVGLRAFVDAALITMCVGIFWLVTAWHPLNASSATLTFLMSAADASFVVTATLAWTRSAPDRRHHLGILWAASLLLYLVDLGYVRQLVLATYAGGSLLDAGWCAVAVAMIHIARSRRSGSIAGVATATWVQRTLAPSIAILVLAALAIDSSTGAHSLPVIVATVVIALTLIARSLLTVAADLDLNHQLQLSAVALEHRVDHDDLTGVLRRGAFSRRVADAVATRRGDDCIALLWLDLDGLKSVNDVYGNTVGDDVLRQVASRLRASTAPGDIIGRLGGDDFAIIAPHSHANLDGWAERIRQAVSAPIVIGPRQLRVTCAVGLLEADASYESEEKILVDLDRAMRNAKSHGSSKVFRFSPGLRSLPVDHREIEPLLRDALADNRLAVRYQPVVDLASGDIVGIEALARLRHPERGLISPAEFLPVAETSHLLVDLAVSVAQGACQLLSAQPNLGSPSTLGRRNSLTAFSSIASSTRAPTTGSHDVACSSKSMSAWSRTPTWSDVRGGSPTPASGSPSTTSARVCPAWRSCAACHSTRSSSIGHSWSTRPVTPAGQGGAHSHPQHSSPRSSRSPTRWVLRSSAKASRPQPKPRRWPTSA